MDTNRNYTVKQYTDFSTFISKVEPFLSIYEIENATLLSSVKDSIHQPPQVFYLGAVWDDNNQVVFAMYVSNDEIFYTGYMNESSDEPVSLLLDQYASITAYPNLEKLQCLHTFNLTHDSLAPLVEQKFSAKTEIRDVVWSCVTKKVIWSPKSLAIVGQANKCKLREATVDDFSLLADWTHRFRAENNVPDSYPPTPQSLVQENLNRGGMIYLMCLDNVPVCMVWKRRPLGKGCAVGYVYTSLDHRHKGYAGACVALFTEVLLKEYEYATLFVKSDMDPKNNLYTRVGYEMTGKAVRMQLSKKD